MEAFKKNILKRSRLMKIGIFILAVVNIGLNIFQEDHPLFEIGISFSMGASISIIVLGSIMIIKYQKALHDEKQLKLLYIQEHDERKNLIKQKTSQSAIIASIVCLMLAANIAIYFNTTVAITLICVIYGLVIITLFFKFYYHKKY